MGSRWTALREWHTLRGGWIYWSAWLFTLALVLACVAVVRSQTSPITKAWEDPTNPRYVLILGSEQDLDTGEWSSQRKYRFEKAALKHAVEIAFNRKVGQ